MSTPPESGGDQGSGGGWEPNRWQSEWQKQQGDQPWQQQPSEQPWQQEPPSQPSWQHQPQGARQGNWQQGPGGQWVEVAPSTNGKATAALVLGILGFVFCPFICSIAAVVLGYQARGEIDNSGGRMGGRSNATAGIVLGWIGLALCAAFIALVIIGLAVGDSGSDVGPTGFPAVI